MEKIIYDKNALEYVTVAVEYCVFMEQATQFTRRAFVERAVRILPLLYLKATLAPSIEEVDGFAEEFVSEVEYEHIKANVGSILKDSDDYLVTNHQDMEFSDTPIAAFISEDLADIYQETKNLAFAYSTRVEESMEVALADSHQHFYEYWGQKLLNALGALHAMIANPDWDVDSEEVYE
ncbi:MAG: DUF5063 domain-containing protein [Bacteroidales bacterium]